MCKPEYEKKGEEDDEDDEDDAQVNWKYRKFKDTAVPCNSIYLDVIIDLVAHNYHENVNYLRNQNQPDFEIQIQ